MERRTVLRRCGAGALAATTLGLAGCSGDGNDGGGGNGDTGGSTSPDDDSSQDAPESTAAESYTPKDGVHTPGPDDDHDWAAIAARDEQDPEEMPSGRPSGYSFEAWPDLNEFTFNNAQWPVQDGTLYLIFLADGEVQEVLVWETPIGENEGILVGPEGSELDMDVSRISTMVVAWEYEGEVYIYEKESEHFEDR